jgi:DNA-binding CsgD family transcriptional regulator
MNELSPQRLSEHIGAIYDCATDPVRWPETLQAICEDIRCRWAAIVMLDLKHSRHRYFTGWNIRDFVKKSVEKYSDQITAIYNGLCASSTIQLDEPVSIYHNLPTSFYEHLPYYRFLLKPLGMVDALQTMVLHDVERQRVGAFFAIRHTKAGLITDREIAIMRLLAPHLRRAATIGDLLNLNAATNETLISVLDVIDVGVIIVGANAEVLHANLAADRMLRAETPVRSLKGQIATLSSDTTDELRCAVTLAQAGETNIGAAGIGVPLRHPNGSPAIAHVLPLGRGEVRTRLAPQAVAAVFIADGTALRSAELDAIARQFKLTPAETRVLARLIAGAAVPKAAEELGLSDATARTHVQRIFRKTRVSRLPDLLLLMDRLAPPIRRM